jgi:hypothetical protein
LVSVDVVGIGPRKCKAIGPTIRHRIEPRFVDDESGRRWPNVARSMEVDWAGREGWSSERLLGSINSADSESAMNGEPISTKLSSPSDVP